MIVALNIPGAESLVFLNISEAELREKQKDSVETRLRLIHQVESVTVTGSQDIQHCFIILDMTSRELHKSAVGSWTFFGNDAKSIVANWHNRLR